MITVAVVVMALVQCIRRIKKNIQTQSDPEQHNEEDIPTYEELDDFQQNMDNIQTTRNQAYCHIHELKIKPTH